MSREGKKWGGIYPSSYLLTASHTSDRPCRHFSDHITTLRLTNCHCDPERGRYTLTESFSRGAAHTCCQQTYDSQSYMTNMSHTQREGERTRFIENEAVIKTSPPAVSTFNDCRQSCYSLVCCSRGASRKLPSHLLASPDPASETEDEGGGYERVKREEWSWQSSQMSITDITT